MVHPLALSNEVAQENYNDPPKALSRIKELGYETLEYYKRTSMYAENRPKALYLIHRTMWRTALAPVLHYIETELDKEVKTRLQAGQPLTPPESERTSHLDIIFKLYGRYEGKYLTFLRASGWLSMKSAKAALGKLTNDPFHTYRPLLDALQYIHHDFAPPSHQSQSYVPRPAFIPNLWRLVTAANITAFNVILPAMSHASLWPDAGSPKEVLLNKVHELSWSEGMGVSAFERNFPGRGANDKPPEVCPFSHDERHIAARSIWQFASLQDGPWKLERYCPASVPLRPPDRNAYIRTTAAAMRLATVIHIADQTLT